MVRSTLEYCSPVWSPNYSFLINLLERVQRKFCKMLLFKFGIEINKDIYHDVLQIIDLQTLQERRRKADLLFLFRLVNNQVQCSELLELVSFRVPSFSSRYRGIFYLPCLKSNYTYFSPIFRILREANLLENRVDIFNQSLTLFKVNL